MEGEMVGASGVHQRKIVGLWRIISYRRKTGLLLAALLFVASCAVIRTMQPVYTATVQLILPYLPIEDPAGRRGAAQTQTDMFVVRGYADIFQSDGLCLSIIDKLKLAELPDFKPHPSLLARLVQNATDRITVAAGGLLAGSVLGRAPDRPADRTVGDADVRRGQILQAYKGRLKAKNDNKSLVLAVSFESADPYVAARIIDAHVAAFVDAQVAYRQREATIKTNWIKSEMEAAATEMRTAQSAIQLHSQHAATVEAAAGEAAELRLRQILAQSRQSVYETLLARYQDLLAEQQYVGSDIRVLSKAVVPIKPSFPKPTLFVACAAFASLLLGFAASTARTLLGNTSSIADAAVANGVDILGHLEIRNRRWAARTPKAGFRLARFWESIRNIRSAFDFGGGGRVVLVTSTTSGEGKSLTAASLARSVAASGFRTLLLDMNVRWPSFYAPSNAGPDLRDYFEEGTSSEVLTVPLDTAIPLYFLGIGREKAFTSLDIFGSARMKALFEEVRYEFDAIVVDAPAMEHVADTLFLADLVDETILVAMEGRTTEASFAQAIATLRGRSIALRGVVIADRRAPKAVDARRVGRAGGHGGLPDIWPSRIPNTGFSGRRKGGGVVSHPIAFAQTMARRLP